VRTGADGPELWHARRPNESRTSTGSGSDLRSRSIWFVHRPRMVSRPVRVLIHPFFFLAEAWNGMDEHLLLLSKHLDRRRYDLRVLIHDSDGPQTTRLAERAGLGAVQAPYRSGAGAMTRLTQLRALYAAQQVDLLHIHSPSAGGQTIAALAARLAGVPITLATYHQIQAHRPSARSRSINYLTHSVLVDSTIAVSEGVKRSLVTTTGLPGGRIRVIHNGIDPPVNADAAHGLPERADDDIWIGYFGRLSPEKGVARLLDSLSLLAPECPTVRTLIVGDGPERTELEAQAERLGIAHLVHFLGFRADARQIMERVDIVAHVPVYEGFGLVAIEAMACGRPVVANDAPGGLSEIIADGDTGLIVPRESTSAIARAIKGLAASPAERARLGRNARLAYERRFTAHQMTAHTAALYEAAFERPGLLATSSVGIRRLMRHER
jgi:glycosyltransferase involved in cell wall biosynthesis